MVSSILSSFARLRIGGARECRQTMSWSSRDTPVFWRYSRLLLVITIQLPACSSANTERLDCSVHRHHLLCIMKLVGRPCWTSISENTPVRHCLAAVSSLLSCFCRIKSLLKSGYLSVGRDGQRRRFASARRLVSTMPFSNGTYSSRPWKNFPMNCSHMRSGGMRSW
jgi:hypothetical protein